MAKRKPEKTIIIKQAWIIQAFFLIHYLQYWYIKTSMTKGNCWEYYYNHNRFIFSRSNTALFYGNWTEWSAIWSEIIRVISKSNERATQVRFEITSMILDQNCTTRSSITNLLHPFWNHTVFLSILIFIWCSLQENQFWILMGLRMWFRAKNGAIWE